MSRGFAQHGSAPARLEYEGNFAFFHSGQPCQGQGLTAKRIHEDLVRDHGFGGSYQSVKRFVRKLEEETPVPYRRMNFAPGELVHRDFGAPFRVGTRSEIVLLRPSGS